MEMAVQNSNYFAQRSAILATKHGKEAVIAPLLDDAFGLIVTVPPAFDSDRFGTFTRDIDRPASQLETARLKALAALDGTDATIAIASEGTFAPHPSLPFLPCDRELVVLIDREHNLELVGETLSTATNFNHTTIATVDTAIAFAKKIGFPSHGLVLMPDPTAKTQPDLVKGICTWDELTAAATRFLATYGRAHLETDMRAMHNPTRMQVIRQATQDLIRKAQSQCPQCHTPGFAIATRTPGLPCELCGSPTQQVLSVQLVCDRCGFAQTQLFPAGVQTADPMVCDYCNP